MIQVDLDPNEFDALLHTVRGWAARENDVANTRLLSKLESARDTHDATTRHIPCTCPHDDTGPWEPDWDGTITTATDCHWHGTPAAR